jgi:uncharacterized protein
MGLFLAVFAIFLLVVLAMSIGFIVQRKSISGSCGGISSLGMEKACDCDEPCDDKKQRMPKQQQWLDQRIQ